MRKLGQQVTGLRACYRLAAAVILPDMLHIGTCAVAVAIRRVMFRRMLARGRIGT
jgi:hypothetical protein